MTYEEALNQGIKMTDEYARNDLERYLLRKEEPIPKSVALGMKALEKQMPKKFEIWNGQDCCPNCKTLFGSDETRKHLISWKMDYCKYCGQAIDWSDKNGNSC